MIYFCKVSLFQISTRLYYHLYLQRDVFATLTQILLHLAFIFLKKLDRNMGFPKILTPKFLP